ncbi:hypothetical protein [Gimesia fumaroli]|nr:hypothetical protein [Gimesia fumaroli]
MPQSDNFPEEKSSEDIANSLMFQSMDPKMRESDPRAYFRARLLSLYEVREGLTSEEYEEERQEVFKQITRPSKRPPLLYPILLPFIFIGLIAAGYGIYENEAPLVVGSVPAIFFPIWFLYHNQRHYQWLNSFSREQRTEIIHELKHSHFIDEHEQIQMLSVLDNRR